MQIVDSIPARNVHHRLEAKKSHTDVAEPFVRRTDLTPNLRLRNVTWAVIHAGNIRNVFEKPRSVILHNFEKY